MRWAAALSTAMGAREGDRRGRLSYDGSGSQAGRGDMTQRGRRPVATRALTVLLMVVAPAACMGQAGFPPPVMGQIVWPEQDLSTGIVRIYKDAQFKTLVDQFGTGGEKGVFALIIDPGEYYLMALVDFNQNKEIDAGDGLGYYGVTAFGSEEKPKPLKITGKSVIGNVMIPIVARFELGEDGRPHPVGIANAGTIDIAPTGLPATVSGRITEAEVDAPIILMALDSTTRHPEAVARITAAKPEFKFEASPGDYYICAFADVSADGLVGGGDLMGSIDVADWSDRLESLPVIKLADSAEIADLEIALNGKIGDDYYIGPEGAEGRLKLDPALLPAIVAGAVRHPAAGVLDTQIRITNDPGMGTPVASVQCERGPGTFICALPPGEYYLTAIVDENPDGEFGPGDTLGFYGVAGLGGGAPAPVRLDAGSISDGLDITIVMKIGPDGRPEALTPEADAEE